MPNVFAKNTTSASITVAGHKVYYIDSTDAEIVEVEGQGGGGSTASDDATGTISGVTLPTAHSYTSVSFDSLRYYAKGTLSNTGGVYRKAFGATYTWYYGTITWEDSSLGDLSSKIAVSDPDGSTYVQQSVFRIIFISGGSITGYRPYDTSDSGVITSQITSYTYSNGVHSITFFNTDNWVSGVYAGRIMLRYLDGVTIFNNLSAFDLVNVSGGALSKATTTDRYDMYNVWNGDITLHALYGSAETIRRNAFKYSLSGTPYWYVIDGEHDTWTDDLSAWGYSEVQPAPVLPEVTFANDTSAGNWITPISGEVTNINAGSVVEGYYWTGSEYQPTVYNLSKVYAAIKWLTSGNVFAGRVEFQFVNYNGTIGIKNNTSGVLMFNQAQLAACHSPDATVITVYNPSNVAYNAFKFTANNTDYYYVLDGTQTDWTDDLSSIGYSLTPVVHRAYLTSSIPHSDKYLNEYSTYSIVDENNNQIPYDSSKSYTLTGMYKVSGSAVTGSVSLTNGDNGYGTVILKLYNSTPRVEVGYVEYTVS